MEENKIIEEFKANYKPRSRNELLDERIYMVMTGRQDCDYPIESECVKQYTDAMIDVKNGDATEERIEVVAGICYEKLMMFYDEIGLYKDVK